jgi:hypothetical protein
MELEAMMRNTTSAFVRAIVGLGILLPIPSLFSCGAHSAAQRGEPTLRSYFASDEGVKSGGVRMVPVKTPKGEFKVWTKRFGNNPRIKCVHRSKPIADSGASRSPSPVQADHSFRSKPIAERIARWAAREGADRGR